MKLRQSFPVRQKKNQKLRKQTRKNTRFRNHASSMNKKKQNRACLFMYMAVLTLCFFFFHLFFFYLSLKPHFTLINKPNRDPF